MRPPSHSFLHSMLWRLHSRKALFLKELKAVLQIVSSQVISFARRLTKNIKTIPHRSHMEGHLVGKDERREASFPTINLSVYFSMCFSIFKIANITSNFRNKFLYAFVIYDNGSTKRAAPLNHIQEIWGSNSDSTVYPEVFWAPAGNFLKYGCKPFHPPRTCQFIIHRTIFQLDAIEPELLKLSLNKP